jgi:5'-3' exonuclease
VHVAHNEDPLDEKFSYWKFLVLNNILKSIRTYKADRCILAYDNGNYWRKDIYAEYKGHRKADRKKSAINFDKFFPVMTTFFEELKDTFNNMMLLNVPRCEADDIIAILTKHELTNYDKIINISNDKDMYQLYKYKNYKQYDPIKKSFVESINPNRQLLLKILTGDKSDNIPSVKTRCGPKTAQSMLDEGLDISLSDDTIKANFERNKKLIDFEHIPFHIKELIIKHYKETIPSTFNSGKVFNFLVKNRLGAFIDKLQEYAPSLNKLS